MIIASGLSHDEKCTKIAESLGCDPTSVSKEIKKTESIVHVQNRQNRNLVQLRNIILLFAEIANLSTKNASTINLNTMQNLRKVRQIANLGVQESELILRNQK